jgi:hypothetical protein
VRAVEMISTPNHTFFIEVKAGSSSLKLYPIYTSMHVFLELHCCAGVLLSDDGKEDT